MAYNHNNIEQKWQKFWEENNTFSVENDVQSEDGTSLQKQKTFYALDMFPFPSGAGLHVGHPEGYTATDIICRKKRMEGYKVLHPMGWDAFGLPAENFAIKTGQHPETSTNANIENFTRQIKSLGFSYDWKREFSTTDPSYYKWTQDLFLKFYEKGLLYEDEKPLNWCPSCKVVCANEEVEQGLHERCGNAVTKKSLKQWMFKITEYAERLLQDLEDPMLDWPEKIKAMQRNWIGKSEGAEVIFSVADTKENKTALILHGWEDAGDPIYRHWQTWLKAELEKKGYEVLMPDFPNPDKPNLAEYLEFLKPYADQMNENSVVIGHSMGGFIGAHFVQNLDVQIDQFISVAPVYNGWAKEEKYNHPYFEEVFETTLSHDYDPTKVTANVKKWKGLFSSNDGVPIEEISAHFDEMGVEYSVIENAGHFCEGDGYSEFPELLNEIVPSITVYTTRPDTLFGATYMVLSPEHPLVETLTTVDQKDAVVAYQNEVKAKSDLERTELNKDKSGVFTGSYAVNPVDGKQIPIWIADYVLMGYGTGAIMAVPAHDERDKEFAEKYSLPIVEVLEGLENPFQKSGGTLINSDFLNGLSVEDGIVKAINFLEENTLGKKVTNYRLRDWIFTRQRYWGEPIPLVFDESGKCYPLAESELPVLLPNTPNYAPSESGESPLAKVEEWVNVKGEIGEDGRVTLSENGSVSFTRETSTMPNWAGSSWYWLRFMDARNENEAWSTEAEKQWGPVDLYVGGAEHAVLHLLYARFWHKALYDMGMVSTKEPFKKLVNQGLILSYAYERQGGGLVPMDEVEEKITDGEPQYFETATGKEVKKIVAKMSKSLKNVVNPDEIVEAYGADTLRMYEMFMGPFEQSKAWDTSAVEGMYKFLSKIHRYFSENEITDTCPSAELIKLTHQTVKKVSNDIDDFKFNTAISQMMIWMNSFSKLDHVPRIAGGKFIRLLAPFAPHLAEELWKKFKPEVDTLTFESWPSYDEALLVENSVKYAVQVNGKLRGDFEISKDASKEECIAAAKEIEKVQKFLSEGEVKKEIFVPGKIVGFVVK